MQTVSLADIVPTSWKNQRGTTQELLAWPATDHWQVRLSVATIDQSGEFSRFEHITRWFSVIDGAGVALRIGDHLSSLNCHSPPLCFDGGKPCQATLNSGVVHAFNVMLGSGLEGQVARLRSGESVDLGSAEFVAIYSVESATCQFAQEIVSMCAGELHWTANAKGYLDRVLMHSGHGLVVLAKKIS